MSSFNWESFLRRWSQEIIDAIDSDQADLPTEILRSAWLGYPGATEEQIFLAEARLETSLPPSYQAFLKVTNGWRQTPLFSNKLWSVEDVDWFSTRHQAWIDAFTNKTEQRRLESSDTDLIVPSVSDAEYFVYGDEQDCSKIRIEYLQTALEISQQGDGVIYLLNPQVIAPNGEWEAWFFGDWLPGADRYCSFQDMMQAEYENFLELRETPNNRVLSTMKIASTGDSDSPTLTETTASSAVSKVAVTEAPMIINTPSVPARQHEWHNLMSFAITFQTRQGQTHYEQRSMVHRQETDTIEIRSGIDTIAIQQWMLKQLKGIPEHTTSEVPVELTITQLRILRSLPTETTMVADRARPLFTDTIQQGEFFTLEVSMHVVDNLRTALANQPLIYRVQCMAHHLSMRLDTDLGDITLHAADGCQSVFTAQFPQTRLQQPGLYSLKVWSTLQNVVALPSYFKVPILQVV